MEVEDAHAPLREALVDSFSFNKNKRRWTLFYVASTSSIVMFGILVGLSSWSVSIGSRVNDLVSQGHETLEDVQKMLPDAEQALAILKFMCNHENFTRTYGHNACPTW